VERQPQHRRLASLDPAPIHERRALDERIVQLGTSGRELGSVIDDQRHDATGRRVDARHARLPLVEARQAVDPRVHVAAVEHRKAQRLGEHVVERLPAHDAAGVDPHDGGLGLLHRDDDCTGPSRDRRSGMLEGFGLPEVL
jgi:hypothetical protein